MKLSSSLTRCGVLDTYLFHIPCAMSCAEEPPALLLLLLLLLLVGVVELFRRAGAFGVVSVAPVDSAVVELTRDLAGMVAVGFGVVVGGIAASDAREGAPC